MRLVLAVPVLAFTAAAHPAAHAAPHAKPAPAPVTVRAQIVAGAVQTAPAYAATAAKQYITDFTLVVAVNGAPAKGEKKRRVRFRCITSGCVLAPANNGDDVNRLDEAAYDVDVIRGRATLHVSVGADRPFGAYTVTAKPITEKGELPVVATFRLTSR